ncbi:hypothetical protein MPDQ_006921 [Monascus purpureus]|uniref:Ran-interacting protein Mog1 n=1 Tax=Monascus purpureus TaxID=5098 RepID=A0A507QXM1_MONPU|nr:hypothetical protein MPDQ_006921 [Monascus purpureus]BDD55595.1 hypothetical protein MAP00_001093 [Monascus purpureus]
MSTFSGQDLYGSALHAVIPEGWIDASNLRQVPDHQEIFLSPRTLSNIIIEINQRVSAHEALTVLQDQEYQPTPPGGAPATAETVDKAAALYHLHDLCDEGDTLEVIVPSRAVSLQKLSSGSGHVTAYTGVVSFTTSQPHRRASGNNGISGINGGSGGGGGRIPVSVDGMAGSASLEGPKTSKSTCHYLLVRLEAQGSDVLVFFNVPHEEFDLRGDPRGLSREEELASETIEKFTQELEVRDWGLFA